MSLQCLIVDDEPLQIALLTDYIKRVPYLQLAGAYSNPLDALRAAQEPHIGLIFLDIEMPELNGVQFAEMIHNRVIFTTAYPNYALKGYDLNVLDYLLKPISFERFLKAVSKAETAPSMRLAPTSESPLFVKVENKIVKVSLSDILYIEGLKEYVAIHAADRKIVTLQSMKKMEEMLPSANFFRTHKSYIVAFDKIDYIERSRIYINSHIIPIGDTYKESFFSMVNARNNL